MNGDYTILDRSMNGIKTLSDGISFISNGEATHENIYYNEFIKSADEKTILLNASITTETIYVEHLNAGDITGDEVDTGVLNCDYLYVNNINNPLQDVLEVDGNLNKLKLYGQAEFHNTVNIINTNAVQTQGGTIQQTGTNFNTLKDTKINGFLEVGSNIVQTGGSTTLKDVTCDNINMNANKGISQSGTGVSNTLGTSTVTNLTITGSVTFPSSVEVPAVTTSDDIVMNGNAVITQDTTDPTTKFNLLRYTKTLALDVGGNLTMTEAGTTATLKNTIIQGTSTLQGDIEQTAGFTKLNTIECNNITLRENNDINISGTGKITQTGTGVNTMSAISLNNNQNLTFNGSGIISQPLSGTNVLSHFRSAGFGIVAGRNNTTYSNTQNIQNNNGLQLQYNRDNSSFYSYMMNNRTGAGGGFRFQRYNAGVFVDEPLTIDENITMNKDLNIVGKSISASSATLGIIGQSELNCLDNCNINILTKFNTLDSEISSLQTTTTGVTSATTGITYSLGSDTTTIDNNLTISSNKILKIGNDINVNSFITNTNTFIAAATNTLQGQVYTGENDTTTFNNNVSVTGNLIVQGTNIKAEIDALETSFTTGTLNTTNLTAGTLNVTNQINMTNPTRGNRNINNIGYANFCDMDAGTDINAFSIGNAGPYTYFNSMKNNGIFQFASLDISGNATNNRLFIMPNVFGAGSYNSTTKADDILVLGLGDTVGTQNLNLSVWSNTATGVRVEPTKTIMTGGSNTLTVDSADGITIDGIQKVNNEMRFYSGANYTELDQSGNDFTINNKSADPKIMINYDNRNLVEFNDIQMKVSTPFQIDNTVEFIPNFISDTSFPKTLGTSNIYVGLMSLSGFKRQINISFPISLYRQYKNVIQSAAFANIIEETLTSVSYTIYKNGIFFGSGTCPTTDTLPRTVKIVSSSSTTSRNYEVYMTNASFSFIPPFEIADNIFTFYINPTYSFNVPIQADNLITEYLGYYTNTNVSTSTYPLSDGTTAGANYSSTSYTFTDYGLKYLTGLGVSKLNSLVSNSIENQHGIITDTLQANTVTATTANSTTVQTTNLNVTSGVKMNIGLAGYSVDGVSGDFISTPVFCSCKSWGGGRANTDNYWYLNGGYKIELFNDVNYATFIVTLDNTSSSVGNIFNLTDVQRDRTNSFKIYFLGNEVALPFIS